MALLPGGQGVPGISRQLKKYKSGNIHYGSKKVLSDDRRQERFHFINGVAGIL